MTNNNKYKEELTINYLKACFDYNPDSGHIHWKERPESHFKTPKAQKAFNTQYAHQIAGTFNTKGYRVIKVGGYTVYAHRLIIRIMTGEWPECVDHIDGDPKNNRFSNLRACTYSDNNRNQRLHTRNKSGYPGVYYHPVYNKAGEDVGFWRAQACIKRDGDHTRKNLGNFKSIEEAIAAKQYFDSQNGYHSNHGRII